MLVTREPSKTATLGTTEGASADEGRLLVTGGDTVLSFPLSRDEVTIGRAPECDIVLANDALSRRHAVLRLAPEMTIEDLGSRNGTRAGGKRLEPKQRAPIAVGEAFQIGRFHFFVTRTRRDRSQASIHDEALRVIEPTADGVPAFVRDLAASPLSLLLVGETGVGKEVLAQTIHELSKRTGTLVRANCAAIAPTLIESELFGHEKSAFTGASHARVGLLEAAQGGTVFLDEIGELPEAIQVKLLRVIETREITRLGAATPITLDVRFIAATNRDLANEVAAGRFRSDLLYRLDGATLTIPPLRAHRERIGPLARKFIAGVAGKRVQTLDAQVLARLEAHDWPGNVRELKAVIERAVILAGDAPLQVRHLAIRQVKPAEARAAVPASPDEAAERQRIVDALEACAGNQTRAAKMLGMSRAAFVTKLDIHRIQRPRK